MSPIETEKIQTQQDFASFIGRVARDYAENGDQWENPDLPRFLDALQAWLESSDGYYQNMKIDPQAVSPWRRLADALAAARIYECASFYLSLYKADKWKCASPRSVFPSRLLP